MKALLNITIFLPLLGVAAAMLIKNVRGLKWVSLIISVATFILALPLLFNFDIAHSSTLQYVTQSRQWIPGYDIKYLVGLDGLSLLLFLLTALFGPVVVLAAWDSVHKHVAGFYAMLMLLETAILGAFASNDIFIFYIFFEASLVPMYFLIGIWGDKERISATVKFFLYTLVGTLLMLVGIFYLGYYAGQTVNHGVFTTDWRILSSDRLHIGLVPQTWLFLSFALAFCIKIPLFPLHSWLPSAYRQAPAVGTVILAAIMVKMGTYGLLKFCLPIFPNAFMTFAPYMAVLGIIGIIYGALVALVQKDVKKLIAYSSLSHLGFIVLGIVAMTTISVQGSIIQMVNHALIIGVLFLILGMIYDRCRTYEISDFGGIAKSVPVLAVAFLVATLASVGLPGLNGFVGEFLILNGSLSSAVLNTPSFAIVATIGIVLSACYMLWMYERVLWGPFKNENHKKLIDLNGREIVLLLPLIIFIVWIGVHPTTFTRYSEQQVEQLLQDTGQKAMAIREQAHTAGLPGWAATVYDVTPKLVDATTN